jgi:hypothetical protein
MKTLPEKWSKQLAAMGETGMGYQVISVTLRDGRKIDDVAVVDAQIIGEVRGYDDIPFDPAEIVAFELTHNRWKFRR